MRTLEWDDMGVKIDGWQLHHLRFAVDIVLISPSITQAERMLADSDHACGKIGLQLNLTKTVFMRSGYLCVLDREVNMTNDLSPELGRRKRAAWGALYVFLERAGPTGLPWNATGTNGDVTGTRSSKSMINGMTCDR
ncbi:unnamed protein product [Nippostrongylus brasiliensis]|uniref:Reverse transcriptase domain-containing protein n=1 Tax=Nippostrongylus brasiliensis TaxID=27835 RepID=A0A0N4XIS8_NIPBR|nr:unnamed protein product [Nippostrongylus brasiliensis]